MKHISVVVALLALIVSACDAGTSNPDEMVTIPQGYYLPLFPDTEAEENQRVSVASFKMGVYPVTNRAFATFVGENAKWARSNMKPIFSDANYLQDWQSELDPGSRIEPDAPVTYVSWFAARAYCKQKGKRLPTAAEWEYVAQASETNRYAGLKDPQFKERILEWYGKPNKELLPKVGSKHPSNFYGVYDMHGIVWEWVSDFNTALVTGESRGDASLDKQLYCGAGSLGASDVENYATFMRYGFRSSLKASYTVSNLGFRCADDLE